MILEFLRECEQAKCLAEIYNEDDRDEFSTFECGFILSVSTEFVEMLTVSKDGELDSHCLIRTKSIHKIARSTRYISGILSSGVQPASPGSTGPNGNLETLLGKFQGYSGVLRMETDSDESYHTANIQSFDEEWLRYVYLDQDGTEDGIELYQIKKIKAFFWNGPKERAIFNRFAVKRRSR